MKDWLSAEKRKYEKIIIVCEYCKEEKKVKLTWGHRSGRNKIKFCSAKCRVKAWFKKHPSYHKDRYKPKPRSTDGYHTRKFF